MNPTMHDLVAEDTAPSITFSYPAVLEGAVEKAGRYRIDASDLLMLLDSQIVVVADGTAGQGDGVSTIKVTWEEGDLWPGLLFLEVTFTLVSGEVLTLPEPEVAGVRSRLATMGGEPATGPGSALAAIVEALDALSGAPYLTTTASGALSSEVVVGATPGGELGGSWASPVVDAVHSGSSHASILSAATDGLATKAPLADAHLTGIPTAPTAATNTSTDQLATTAFVQAIKAAILDGVGPAFDTFIEVYNQLVADESVVTALTTVVAAKETPAGAQAKADAKVSDAVYSPSGWNGVTDVAPSKNTVRDQIESLSGTFQSRVIGVYEDTGMPYYNPLGVNPGDQTGAIELQDGMPVLVTED